MSLFRVAIQRTDFMLIKSQASNALQCKCKHSRKHEQMAAYRIRICAWQLNSNRRSVSITLLKLHPVINLLALDVWPRNGIGFGTIF